MLTAIVRSDGSEEVALVHDERGAGLPVLFLHGLGGSLRYWRPVVDHLDGSVRSCAVDLLGFGRSPKPPDASYDIDCHLNAIEPLLAPGTVVVGHSTGAILAVALARRHPEHVAGLVLTGLPLYPDRPTAIRSISRLGAMAKWTVAGNRRARWTCAAMCRLRPVAIALAPVLVRDLPAEVAADGARHTWPAYSRTLRHVILDHDTASDLAAVPIPVKIIQGARDQVAPPEMLREVVEALLGAADPRITVQVVEGDHHVALRTPAAIADALTSRPR